MTPNSQTRRHRYVFVGGLHRSGTSLVADLIGRHGDVSAIRGAPVPEDEGVYLQGAIPHTARMGRPGSFAFDEAQHLTETSSYNTLATRDYLMAQWDTWYDAEATWRVEKSPVNIMRARLYQQLLPTSQFVFVVRHPVAVSEATRKWTRAGPEALLAHWEAAHARLLNDLTYLHAWLILRYEDLVADPRAAMDRVWTFLDLGAPADGDGGVDATRSEAYLAAASGYPERSEIAARLGYALRVPFVAEMPGPRGRHPYNSRSALIA